MASTVISGKHQPIIVELVEGLGDYQPMIENCLKVISDLDKENEETMIDIEHEFDTCDSLKDLPDIVEIMRKYDEKLIPNQKEKISYAHSMYKLMDKKLLEIDNLLANWEDIRRSRGGERKAKRRGDFSYVEDDDEDVDDEFDLQEKRGKKAKKDVNEKGRRVRWRKRERVPKITIPSPVQVDTKRKRKKRRRKKLLSDSDSYDSDESYTDERDTMFSMGDLNLGLLGTASTKKPQKRKDKEKTRNVGRSQKKKNPKQRKKRTRRKRKETSSSSEESEEEEPQRVSRKLTILKPSKRKKEKVYKRTRKSRKKKKEIKVVKRRTRKPKRQGGKKGKSRAPKLVCFCNRPYSRKANLISCGKIGAGCQREYFHPECIGFSKRHAPPKNWCCSECRERDYLSSD